MNHPAPYPGGDLVLNRASAGGKRQGCRVLLTVDHLAAPVSSIWRRGDRGVEVAVALLAVEVFPRKLWSVHAGSLVRREMLKKVAA